MLEQSLSSVSTLAEAGAVGALGSVPATVCAALFQSVVGVERSQGSFCAGLLSFHQFMALIWTYPRNTSVTSVTSMSLKPRRICVTVSDKTHQAFAERSSPERSWCSVSKDRSLNPKPKFEYEPLLHPLPTTSFAKAHPLDVLKIRRSCRTYVGIQ